MKFVFIGLSITSSWGNGHATTYRALINGLSKRGHEVLFLERDVPYYARNRDMPDPPFCRMSLYTSVAELKKKHQGDIGESDVVVVGSYVPQGVEIGRWVIETAGGIAAFYDIDTPVTLSMLERKDCQYLEPDLIAGYDLYLSFTGGPTLELIRRKYGAPLVRELYCSVDHTLYYPEATDPKWDLGYLGTYSADRQPTLEMFLCEAAKAHERGRFIAAGPQYPEHLKWPANVERIDHLPPGEHRRFYNAQKYTLNITRSDMIRAGFSPSVRLFEAAACGIPIISDYWDGLGMIFKPHREILIARSTGDVLHYLKEITEEQRVRIGDNARRTALAFHTAETRARQLEEYIAEA